MVDTLLAVSIFCTPFVCIASLVVAELRDAVGPFGTLLERRGARVPQKADVPLSEAMGVARRGKWEGLEGNRPRGREGPSGDGPVPKAG